MPSRIGSMLSRTNSMKRTTLGGLKDTLRTHHLTFDDDTTYGSNEYIHKRFFDDDNFLSIIKCLEGGYDIAKDHIEYMEEYRHLLHNTAHNYTSYANKWKSKLKQQPSLSSYHTTKRAQLQTVRSPEKLAELLQSRCDAIQQVITTYRTQVDRMYPSERLGTVHKHYRAGDMKKLFKAARSPLSKISERLEELHEQEKKAQDALHAADIQCENLGLDQTASKNKVARASDNQEKRQDELKKIQERISRAEAELNQEQETYYEKARDIYQQCRELEKERLDQIRETLIKFIQVIHTPEYSDGYNTVFEELLSNVKNEQDSVGDLDFWAQTYHVDILKKSLSSEANDNTTESQKIETANVTTTEEKIQQPSVDNEDEQLAADTTTTSTKTKGKKNKKNTTTEPVTPNAS